MRRDQVKGTGSVDTPERDTKSMLLSWFERDELGVCPACKQQHVLPTWGTAVGRYCASCGLIELQPNESG